MSVNFKQMNPFQIIDRYYSKFPDLHYILVTHSNQVKDKALEVIQNHPELNADRQFVEEAALLHDIGIFMTDAPRIHCYGLSLYIQHGFLGAELLRSEGLEKHALVSERHTGTGISLELIQQRNLPLPVKNMRPLSVEEKIICYADKFYSKTELHRQHSLERIEKSLSHHDPAQWELFKEWNSLYG